MRRQVQTYLCSKKGWNVGHENLFVRRTVPNQDTEMICAHQNRLCFCAKCSEPMEEHWRSSSCSKKTEQYKSFGVFWVGERAPCDHTLSFAPICWIECLLVSCTRTPVKTHKEKKSSCLTMNYQTPVRANFWVFQKLHWARNHWLEASVLCASPELTRVSHNVSRTRKLQIVAWILRLPLQVQKFI